MLWCQITILSQLSSKEALADETREKPKNALGKFIDKAFGQSGWTLRIESNYTSKFDTRVLVAGLTLLHVRDIVGVNR